MLLPMISSTAFIRMQFLNLLGTGVGACEQARIEVNTPMAQALEQAIPCEAQVIPLPVVSVAARAAKNHQAEQWRNLWGAMTSTFRMTPGEINAMSEEVASASVARFDVPEKIRDLTMHLEVGSLGRALLLVRNILLPQYDPLKALDLVVAVLKVKGRDKDVAYFEAIRRKAAGGEKIDVEAMPGEFLTEAHRLLEEGKRCGRGEEKREDKILRAQDQAELASIAWIILGSRNPQAAAKARAAWHLIGMAMELRGWYVLAAGHWGAVSDHVREGLANFYYAQRVMKGEEDFYRGIDGEVTEEEEASNFFGDAKSCFEKAGFPSVAHFMMGLASKGCEEGRFEEAAFAMESLCVYFDYCQPRLYGDPYHYLNLHVAALLDQVELWRKSGNREKTIEALDRLRFLARIVESGNLQKIAADEMVQEGVDPRIRLA